MDTNSAISKFQIKVVSMPSSELHNLNSHVLDFEKLNLSLPEKEKFESLIFLIENEGDLTVKLYQSSENVQHVIFDTLSQLRNDFAKNFEILPDGNSQYILKKCKMGMLSAVLTNVFHIGRVLIL